MISRDDIQATPIKSIDTHEKQRGKHLMNELKFCKNSTYIGIISMQSLAISVKICKWESYSADMREISGIPRYSLGPPLPIQTGSPHFFFLAIDVTQNQTKQ